MKQKYTSPAVTLVGGASDVVLGVFGAGTDIWDQVLVRDMEFAADQLNSVS
jgi:hypothetical protein